MKDSLQHFERDLFQRSSYTFSFWSRATETRNEIVRFEHQFGHPTVIYAVGNRFEWEIGGNVSLSTAEVPWKP